MKKNQTLYNSFQIPSAVLPVVPVTSTTAASVPLPSNHLVLNDQHISQIERIQSLSEQISMLEERLEGCKYPPPPPITLCCTASAPRVQLCHMAPFF